MTQSLNLPSHIVLERRSNMKKVLAVLVIVGIILATTVSGAFAFPAGTWVSGVTVANLSADTATVMITFYNPDGSVALDFSAGTIGGNRAKTWYLPSHVSGLPGGFLGSAVVLGLVLAMYLYFSFWLN